MYGQLGRLLGLAWLHRAGTIAKGRTKGGTEALHGALLRDLGMDQGV